MNSKSICIIGAMECEIIRLKSLLKNIEEIKYGVFSFYKGTINNKNVVIVKSGVGKVCAAVCTQILADKFNPQYIINTGIAGGIKDGLKIGDIIIGQKLVQHDFDASATGYSKGYICDGNNPDKPTYFYSDEKLISKFKKSIKSNMRYFEGVIASGDMFIGTKEKKKELETMYNAIAAEMEAAAIAHAAALNKIPFIIIRAISDFADENAAYEHAKVEQMVADISSNAVQIILD